MVDICARILFLLIIFSVFMTRSLAHGITSMIHKWLDKLRDMFLDRVTLKQGKTYCRRGLMMDPIVHVVMDADVDIWSKSAIWCGIH